MTDVVLWRHGRTEYNAARRLQGQIDIPLDEVGRWQGTTAAAALFARHTPVRIVSSDLVRARSTAGSRMASTVVCSVMGIVLQTSVV